MNREPGWLQKPLWSPEIAWKAPDVAKLPSWRDAKRVCVDVETRDDDLYELGPGVRRGGYVCGIGFAIEDGEAHYLPIAHQGGGNLDPALVWQYLRDNAAIFTGEVVFNSAPYDLDYLWENGVTFQKASWIRDVQVAEPLLDENQKTYGLNAICARRGLPGKDEAELNAHAKAWGVDPKRGLWRLHAGCVGRYAERDVRAPLQLLRRQEREIEEQDLRRIYDLESKVTPALVRMTRRGIRVDLDELGRVETWAQQRLQDFIDQIHHLTDVRVNSLSNASQLYPALKKRGLDVPTPIHAGTKKPTPSIKKLWLEGQNDEVCKAIVTGREFVKLLGTYVAGYRKHLIGDRIHPSFKQLHSESDDDEDEDDGARFGRTAAKHPNVQASMKRSRQIKKRWRKVIVPDEGKRWYKGDFCYSADTEVLTTRGWIRFDKLMIEDRVAQWDNGIITFVQPTKHWRSPFAGELVSIEGRRFDIAVTGNHEMIYRTSKGELIRRRADQYNAGVQGRPYKGQPATNKTNLIPQCGKLLGGAPENHDLLRLVVAIQADATDRGNAWRFWLSREDKIARAKALLTALGIPFTTGFSPAKGNQSSIQFKHDTRIDRYLSRVSKNFDRAALVELDVESRLAFLGELYFWDGSRKRKIYYSTNFHNIDVVQILYILTGTCASAHWRRAQGKKALGEVAPLQLEGGKLQKVEAGPLAYEGDVFCVTVPAGAIVTRRNGKVAVASNSQQEPRLTVHYAEICRLPGASAAAQRFRDNPRQDSYDLMVELCKLPRDDVKELYLGRCYGMGGGKLARKLKLPTIERINRRDGQLYEAAGPEAQAILDTFDRAVPYVRALQRRCSDTAKARKYIVTIGGRRCRFEVDANGNILWEHKALNRLVQGGSADQTKAALVLLEDAGYPLQITVHDEFGYSGDDDQQGSEMADIMKTAMPLRVPSRVDIEVGTSYGDLHPLIVETSA